MRITPVERDEERHFERSTDGVAAIMIERSTHTFLTSVALEGEILRRGKGLLSFTSNQPAPEQRNQAGAVHSATAYQDGEVRMTEDYEDEELSSNIDNEAFGSEDHTSSSAHSKTNGSSTGGTPSESANTHQSAESLKMQELAEAETKQIAALRYFVLTILTFAAFGVSVLVLYISRTAQVNEMETQFQAATTRLLQEFEAIRTERIASLAALAVAATAHGVDHTRDWPFVSLSSFQQRAVTAKANSKTLQVSIAPLVTQDNRLEWELYVTSDEADTDWMEQAIDYQGDAKGINPFIEDYGTNFREGPANTTFGIKKKDLATGALAEVEYDDANATTYLPTWVMSPFLNYDQVNVDMLHNEEDYGYYAKHCLEQGGIVLGKPFYNTPGGIDSPEAETAAFAQLLSIDAGEETEYLGDPMTNLFIPVFDSFAVDHRPVAVMVGMMNWRSIFKGVLAGRSTGIDVVLRNTCYDPFTFRINGPNVIPVGPEDLHDPYYDSWEVVTPVLETGSTQDGEKQGLNFTIERDCNYFLSIYPSQAFEEQYKTSEPWMLVTAVAGVLVFAVAVFYFYDRLVERRQALVLRKAIQSSAIVSSLFPKNVRDRLMANATNTADSKDINKVRDTLENPTGGYSGSRGGAGLRQSFVPVENEQTIADLFPACTVMFGDIAGFTAWSSTRDPSQVFTLLQNLYAAFDSIALRRRVFKVETIGDCYLAVTGLPEPQADHALIMCKYARDCLIRMHEVTGALEVRLGPDTTELSMRFGLNSGQVTGGVLRGDRARFQLFGDTVNTAARMESTGERGRIHLSQSTADQLVLAGKGHWIKLREDMVAAKGKGMLQTYWLEMDSVTKVSNKQQLDVSTTSAIMSSTPPSLDISTSFVVSGATKKQSRLVEWMTEVLLDYAKQIVAKNQALGVRPIPGQATSTRSLMGPAGRICLDELVEAIDLPKEASEAEILESLGNYHAVDLDPQVAESLNQFVSDIASRYHPTNPFHNFDHACHVTMSVHKLMKRVVNDVSDGRALQGSDPVAAYRVLTTDPLTLFAIVFTGLIHDVDHRGISNFQLSKENPDLSEHYRNKSIAEQNSFDIAWDLLMSKQYDNLRQAIFPRVEDLMRFRQVVINSVLATDIFDKELGDMRKERWKRVFGASGNSLEGPQQTEDDTARNTKATIVLEHIIQASDVSHTMQHWHVYVKWNRKLFEELHLAYTQGRMEKDPATFWYQGELGFFDNYVIPLAKKLQECRVFGVSSDEYLNYALSNRTEWETRGNEMIEEFKRGITSPAY